MKAKLQTLFLTLVSIALLLLRSSTATAQENVLSYQGRVQSSGTNFSGPGQFKFALVTVTNDALQATAVATTSGGFLTILTPTAVGSGYGSAPAVTITGGGGSGAAATANVSGGSVVSYTVTSTGSGYTSIPTVTVAPPPVDLDYTTYWSNDGSSGDGGEPSAVVTALVNKGLFTVRLGDTNLPNMRKFPVGLFNGPNLVLLTWFNDGVHGFGLIQPRHRLTAVPYAFAAESVSGTVAVGQLTGLINSDQIAPNAITSAKIAEGAIAPNNLSTLLRSNTFWRMGGNADTTGGQDFLGTTDNKPLDLRVNNVRAMRLEDNGDSTEDDDSVTDEAPNVIGGSKWNRVGAGVVGATIAGGGATNGVYDPIPPNLFPQALSRSNAIYANYSSIGGGLANQILPDSGASTISGGRRNDINSSSYAVIAGGTGNSIENSSPAGFLGNVLGGGAAIGGGTGHHIADSEGGTIAGGYANEIAAAYGSIGGGKQNKNLGGAVAATIAGGYANEVSALSTSIGGGSSNNATADYATVAGGQQNTSDGSASVVAGGRENEAGGGYSAVTGGRQNAATGHYSFVGGGTNNVVSGGFAAIGGGLRNRASGAYSVVASGEHNEATGTRSAILGGAGNTASGEYSVVVGGHDNQAEGNYSFAGGRGAWAYNNGSFAWGDSTTEEYLISGANQFKVRASGGVELFSKADLTAGVKLEANASAWTTVSDRAAKKDFAPLDCTAVLDRLMDVPIQRWHYNWEEETATPHIGPTAQDFKAAFYPGRDDKGITTLEFDGVALAAIQGLNEKVESGKQKAETRMEQLEAENAGLKQRLEKLERLVSERNGSAR